MGTKKRRVVSYIDGMKIAKLFEEHSKKDAEGYIIFDEGWSDKRIAKEVTGDTTPPISEVSVARVRTNSEMFFGRLRQPIRSATSPNNQRIAGLERKVLRLEEQVRDLYDAKTRP